MKSKNDVDRFDASSAGDLAAMQPYAETREGWFLDEWLPRDGMLPTTLFSPQLIFAI